MIRLVLLRVKRLLLRANDALAVLSYLAHGRRPKNGLVVLCYHRVARDLPKNAPFHPYNVAPDDFALHVAHLRGLKNATVVSLKEIGEWLDGTIPTAGSFVLLTFDDGWRHLLGPAAMLAENRLPAAVFVPTAYLGAALFEFPDADFDAWCRRQPNADPDWYTPLTVADCRHLQSLGLDVQAHGHRHLPLGYIAQHEMEEDVSTSLKIVREEFNPSVIAFAYPYGSTYLGGLSDAVVEFLRDSKVALALSTDAGTNSLRRLRENALRLKRIPVNEHDRGLFFAAKAAGYTGALPAIKYVVHHLRSLARRCKSRMSRASHAQR